MIRVSKLTKDYGPRRAINELDFEIQKGEIVGFLGPNGAGKTTTMRILAGYMPPTAGEATIAGFDIIDQSLEVRRIVGYMPETVPLYPDMTVSEYLTFMADLRHIPNPKERVSEVLGLVHMQDRAKGYISNLSKGMRQRIGLAQAILHSPDLLILDEPTIGLDPGQIIEVRNLIREIGKEHTVLLSTHILPEAQQVCDRVIIINKGHIVAEDTTVGLQSRLIGVQQVKVTVKGEPDGLIPILTDIQAVTQVTVKRDSTLEIEMMPGDDARPEIARRIISAGYDLLSLSSSSMSLEDIFLELTRDEPLAPAFSEESASEEVI
jgi:ABC-2 type transport system ATP-binding protein